VIWKIILGGWLVSASAGVAWHYHDKGKAVAAAISASVTLAEHGALQAELEGLRKLRSVQVAANENLRVSEAAARADAQAAADELERYERETTVDPSCAVTPDLLRRLRAN